MRSLIFILTALVMVPLAVPAQEFKVIDVNARHRIFKGVNDKLFNAALNGKVEAYNGVMDLISPEDIEVLGRRESIVAIYPDADDPNYYYDSLVVEEFSADNVDGYIFMVDSATADTPTAIGIYYNVTERSSEGEKVELRQDLFWVKWEEALPLLHPAERKYLINLFELQEGVDR